MPSEFASIWPKRLPRLACGTPRIGDASLTVLPEEAWVRSSWACCTPRIGDASLTDLDGPTAALPPELCRSGDVAERMGDGENGKPLSGSLVPGIGDLERRGEEGVAGTVTGGHQPAAVATLEVCLAGRTGAANGCMVASNDSEASDKGSGDLDDVAGALVGAACGGEAGIGEGARTLLPEELATEGLIGCCCRSAASSNFILFSTIFSCSNALASRSCALRVAFSASSAVCLLFTCSSAAALIIS